MNIKKVPIINVDGERVINIWKEHHKYKDLSLRQILAICRKKGYSTQKIKYEKGIYHIRKSHKETFLLHRRRNGWYVWCHEQLAKGPRFVKIESEEQLKQFIDLLKQVTRKQISKEAFLSQIQGEKNYD